MTSLKTMVKDIAYTYESREEYEGDNYTLRVVSAVCGEYVTHQQIQTGLRPGVLELRMEVFVSGVKLERALDVFKMYLMKDVLKLAESNTDVIVGVHLTSSREHEAGAKVWRPSDIQNKKKASLSDPHRNPNPPTGKRPSSRSSTPRSWITIRST